MMTRLAQVVATRQAAALQCAQLSSSFFSLYGPCCKSSPVPMSRQKVGFFPFYLVCLPLSLHTLWHSLRCFLALLRRAVGVSEHFGLPGEGSRFSCWQGWPGMSLI